MTEKIRSGFPPRLPRAVLLLALSVCFLGGAILAAQAPAQQSKPQQQAAAEKPYIVEYYYKVQWGLSDEWLALFKKNHLPLLKALKAQGAITDLEMEKPLNHTTEDGRWDYRVAITWKNFAASNSSEDALRLKLFPDQTAFKREEQRRFQILIAHWDLPVTEVVLEP
jgi:hypothetical protein